MSDVSVIIPTFGRVARLRRALSSVEAQTQQPTHVIVIDDGSPEPDATKIRSVIAEFDRSLDIRLIVNDRNRGANYSRNRGIFLSQTSFIAFLDSDDIWFPEKLAMQLNEIRRAKERDGRPVLSATGRYRVAGSGAIIAQQFGGLKFDANRIKRSNFIGTLSSVIVETSVARQISGFVNDLPAGQDWDFFIRLSPLVQFVGVPEPLCIYVDDMSDRISRNSRKRILAHLYLMRTHAQGDHVFKAKIYRIIAEEFQQLGRFEKANQYLAKSVFARDFFGRRTSKWLECILISYFQKIEPQLIRRQRYRSYQVALTKAMSDPAVANKVRLDEERIRKMMSN